MIETTDCGVLEKIAQESVQTQSQKQPKIYQVTEGERVLRKVEEDPEREVAEVNRRKL